MFNFFCLVVQAELFIDLDEVNGDEELRTAYPCPFCTEDFDLLELCCHIDLDHPVEAKSGVFFFVSHFNLFLSRIVF